MTSTIFAINMNDVIIILKYLTYRVDNYVTTYFSAWCLASWIIQLVILLADDVNIEILLLIGSECIGSTRTHQTN